MASDPTNSPNPSASDLPQPSPGGEVVPASSGISTLQNGFWINDPTPQFVIRWTLQEGQDSQLAGSNASQAAPPTTYKARVSIFQEVFETTLETARPAVPFSLRDAITPFPYLQGSFVLLQQPSDPPELLVKNLKFSGFQQAQIVLFSSAIDAPGGEGGG